jgi:MYXO-CTERM domain-containing protein
MPRTTLLITAAFAVTLIATTASADVAPGPEDCTVSYYETGERGCERCEWDECEDQFAGTDYSHVCDGEYEIDEETGDERPEHEIWCEPAPDTPGPNCSTGSATLLPPVAGLALLALGGAALWWTRRR